MPNQLVGRAVGNLLGGATQQPENVRFLNMASESINAWPTLEDGLDKRPGTKYIAVAYQPAGVGNTVQALGHFINRDANEKYALVLYRDGTAGVAWSVRAVNLVTGATVPIYSDTSGTALGTALNDYLLPAAAEEQATDEREHIRMMTAGDTTFLLNRRRIAKMETATTSAQDDKALVWVRAGAYGQKYGIKLDGTEYKVDFRDVQSGLADGLTPDGSVATHARYIGPEFILRRLLTDITGADVTVTQIDHRTWRVKIKNVTGGNFKLSFYEFTTAAWVQQTTAAIAYSAAAAGATMAANIDAALEAVYPGAAVFTVSVGPTYIAGVEEDFDIVTDAQMQLMEIADNSFTGTGGTFTWARSVNVAWVDKISGGSFTIEPDDANYTNLMYVVRGDVEDIGVLPELALHGFKVRVAGVNEDGSDDWYASFTADAGSGIGKGKWAESVGWGVKYQVDRDTMPHVFRSYVKSSVGTHPAALAIGDPYFVFEPATWDDRAAGDDETNPIPAIFDRKLDALAFHRGRLVLMSGEVVCASEAGNPFNLFRVSVASLLDTDRIDLTSQIRDASDFRASVEHNQQLVLFSDQSQAVMDSGGGVLSPSTVGLLVAGSAQVDPDGGPVTSGPYIFAPFRRGKIVSGAWSGNAGVYQMLDVRGGDRLRLEVQDITEHVPRYIEGSIIQMAASTTEHVLALVTDQRDDVYLYRWQDTPDGRRVQGAWQKARIATSYAETTPPRIVSIGFIESTLYLLTFRDSDGMGLVLEKIEFAPGARDDDFWSKILLDNRVQMDQIAGTTVALVGSDTVVTFPAGTWKRRGDGATGIVYAVLADITGQAGGTVYTSNAPAGGGGGTAVVTFPGVDLTAKTFYIGQKYTMRHTVSPVYLERPDYAGGRMALIAGHTSVKRAVLDVAQAASVKAEIAHQGVGGTTSTRSFLHTTAGGADITPFSGSKSIPILSANDDYELTLINDSPWGSRLNGIEYEVNYHARSRRIG